MIKKVGTIHAGDLKLWSGDGLVLFYNDFPSSYQYTDLGTMSDSQGLAEALGSGDVIITIEVAIDALNNSNHCRRNI